MKYVASIVLALGLAACSNDVATAPSKSMPNVPSLSIAAPTGVTAALYSCHLPTASLRIDFTLALDAYAARIEVSHVGTRDRAGHPWSSWFVSRTSPYYVSVPANQVWDVYVANAGGGSMSANVAVLGVTSGPC